MKSFLRFLLVPIDLVVAIYIGWRLRQMWGGSRIYIFDFDNTLVQTARCIAEKQSYTYAVEELAFHQSMHRIALRRLRRGHPCMVLSARPYSDRRHLKQTLGRGGISSPVELVGWHWLKAVSLITATIFSNIKITLVDDMMRGEESGNPRPLFFPFRVVPKSIRLVTHEDVMRIR